MRAFGAASTAAMHESQSKFYEDQVGRSLEFWTAFYPEIQKEVPKFRDIPVETVVRALNKPESGLVQNAGGRAHGAAALNSPL